MRLGKISEWTKPGEEINFKSIRLKPMQIAIINCNRFNNVLVNLPTGFGKSLLFQYPASQLTDKCIVVFVPLKALLWDCLKQAELLNITACELTPAFIRKYQKDSVIPQLFFLTPERLFGVSNGVLSFVDMLYFQNKIDFMVIDEAHCISEWGSDFRPDYSKLCQLRGMFPNVRILGMSATIPPQARQDLITRLKMPGCYYFQSSSNRSNLIYEVKTVQKSSIPLSIISYLQDKQLKDAAGIIYCQTIKSSQQIFEKLTNLKFQCCLFHSKLSQKQRSTNFDNFMKEKTKVVVATICFGMGVNKKNIRYVINVGVSLSAQNYYQESGRAGRDGETSYCLLLSYKGDVNPLQYLISQSTKKEKLKRRRIYKLSQIKDYTKVNQCRKRRLFALLGQQFTADQCKKTCDFCQNGYESQYTQLDYTQKALRLMQELAGINVKVTKIQLVNLLKGKDANLTDKITKEKTKVLLGMLKQENNQRIQLMIDTLIQQKFLIKLHHFTKGKFKRKIQYLAPCNKTDLKKQRNKPIKLKVFTLKPKNDKLEINTTVPKVSALSKRFQNFINKKSKSQEFDFSKPTTSPTIEKTIVQANVNQPEENELEEIKMITMTSDYQQYFDDLFGAQLEEQTAAQFIDLTKEEKQEKDQEQGPRLTEFQTCQDQELQHPISQPPVKLLSEQGKEDPQQEKSDEDSLDFEFLQMIRKKKAQLSKKQDQLHQKKPVIRTNISPKLDFL